MNELVARGNEVLKAAEEKLNVAEVSGDEDAVKTATAELAETAARLLAEILGTLDIRPEELEEVLAGALGGRGPAVPQGLPPELAELVVSGNARVIEITPEQLAAMVGGRVPDELEALFDSAIGSAAAEPEDPLEALFSKPLEIK